jgi:hypothetical protein
VLDIPLADTTKAGRCGDAISITTNGRHSAVRSTPTPAGGPALLESDAFELARRFVEHHLAAENAGTRWSERPVDRETLQSAVAGCTSLEHAIGRAIVVLTRLRPLDSVAPSSNDAQLPPPANDPFFSFSVSDTAADFGDGTRFRARVARRMAAVLRMRGEHLESTTPSLAFGTEP